MSPVSKDKLIQLVLTFDIAMGLAAEENNTNVACKNEVVLLKHANELAAGYPPKPTTCDALFYPRAVCNTGQAALLDMHRDKNTLFSCLSRIDENYNFTPIGKPDYISALEPEDRCHLNGMTYTGESIEYVTVLSTTDSCQGCCRNKLNGVVLIHVPAGKTILSGLAMPHSPRLRNNKLNMLISAKGFLSIEYNSLFIHPEYRAGLTVPVYLLKESIRLQLQAGPENFIWIMGEGNTGMHIFAARYLNQFIEEDNSVFVE